MTASREQVHILITDLDNTAVALQKIDPNTFSKFFPKRISPQFLTFMRRNLAPAGAPPAFYSGFYVCTHRILHNYSDPERFTSYFDRVNFETNTLLKKIEKIDQAIPHLTAKEVEKANKKKADLNQMLAQSADCSEAHPNEDFTFRIVANLEKATKKRCFAVSTPEDVKGECGEGYEAILKPYERYAMKHTRTYTKIVDNAYETKLIPTTTYPSPQESGLRYPRKPISSFDGNTKNEQILSIVEDIKKQKDFANKDYILDFVDDKDSICTDALAMKPDSLLENMTLRVFKADAVHYSEDINDCMGEVRGRKPLIQTTPLPSVANFSILGQGMSPRKSNTDDSMSAQETAEQSHGVSLNK